MAAPLIAVDFVRSGANRGGVLAPAHMKCRHLFEAARAHLALPYWADLQLRCCGMPVDGRATLLELARGARYVKLVVCVDGALTDEEDL